VTIMMYDTGISLPLARLSTEESGQEKPIQRENLQMAVTALTRSYPNYHTLTTMGFQLSPYSAFRSTIGDLNKNIYNNFYEQKHHPKSACILNGIIRYKGRTDAGLSLVPLESIECLDCDW